MVNYMNMIKWGISILAGIAGFLWGMRHWSGPSAAIEAVLMCAAVLTVYRLIRGPGTLNRAVALKALGIIMAAFCGVLAAATGEGLYLDIALAWIIQALVGTIIIARHLEGEPRDD